MFAHMNVDQDGKIGFNEVRINCFRYGGRIGTLGMRLARRYLQLPCCALYVSPFIPQAHSRDHLCKTRCIAEYYRKTLGIGWQATSVRRRVYKRVSAGRGVCELKVSI